MQVNISKTREYYQSLTEDSLSDCGYCRNYRLLVKSAFPMISVYLDSLGIDIEKPFELLPLVPDKNGMLEYCGCQYIVFGSCEPEFQHRINNVEFHVAKSHPMTGIEQEHFVLEFFPINLKYIC